MLFCLIYYPDISNDEKSANRYMLSREIVLLATIWTYAYICVCVYCVCLCIYFCVYVHVFFFLNTEAYSNIGKLAYYYV